MSQNIARMFIIVGAVAALVGMVMGIGMGMAEEFTYSPVHAHINLVGSASLALFGLAYKTGLAKQDRLAVIHFWVAVIGAIVLPLGIYISMSAKNPALAIIGSLITLVSMILFLVDVARAKG